MRPTIGWSWSAALLCAACGAQVVSFDVDLGDGGPGSSVGSMDATSDSRPVVDASPPDPAQDANGPPFGHHDAATMCVLCTATMGSCAHDSDCCEGDRCVANICLPPAPTCSAPGLPCLSIPITCCSGRCEPTGPGGTPVCAPYCEPDNSPCSTAAECCSLACNGGFCGGAICSTVGSICQFDNDCCSSQCVGNRCVPSASTCLPSGESCSDAGIGCCSGVCNEMGRCGVVGAVSEYGSCLAPAAPCSRFGFPSCCENAACVLNMTAHVSTCQTQGPQGSCTPDTQRCLENDDCCSKTCNSGVCGTICASF